MKDFSSEISFKTARSSGPGGQNVNKVETSVTARWQVESSLFFDEAQKTKILHKLKNKINSDGFLQVTVRESRSQATNKEKAIQKILSEVETSLKTVKRRIKTKPSRSSKEKRLKTKKILSEKKKRRGKGYEF